MILKSVQWGIIGCGNVTELKSGPAFNRISGSDLIAVMRRDRKKAQDYAQRHQVPKWYDDADELIKDPEINAVYVATPPLYHAEYTIRAMKAGKPVYVEKPMAAAYSDCVRMNRVAEETGMPLFVAYYRRSLPYFLKVKELIEENKIGKILSVDLKLVTASRKEDHDKNNLPWRVNRNIAGGGYFYDLACHQLDILDYFFGQISEVYGVFSNRKGLYATEDTVASSFQFENGIVGTGLWSFVADESSGTDRMEITGEYGSILFSAFDFSPIVLRTKEKTTEFKPENPENIQYYLIRDVVEELMGTGRSPSNGISGARTNKVMDIILRKL
ncbi:MAG: Gfo/Idh/MocA family oxidoreductase [Bacteroidales bacterium]|nr:Gfo/Idh/MocA family oxidoreductase [Bacteroidales bacterium]